MSHKDKTSLMPIHEVYNKLRWDPRFNVAHFIIQYQERSGRLKDKPLAAWNPAGDVPWHRVRQVRYGDEVVWDREQRIERLDELLEPHTLEAPPAALDTQAKALSCWSYDQLTQEWEERQHPHGPRPAPLTLRAITLNALFDLYDEPHLETPLRLKATGSTLEALDADLIILTEITPTMLDVLLALDWVRTSYMASEGPLAEHLEPYGQLILSRHPMQLSLLPLGGHKTLLIARVMWSNQELVVGAVHLSSNSSDDGPSRRQEQLNLTLNALEATPNLLLTGDFNLQEDELSHLFHEHQLRDLWPAHHPKSAGITFDPEHNALAKRHSRSGRQSRYDRFYLRSEQLTPTHMRTFGQTPVKADLPISDHLGVLVELALPRASATQAQPVVQSAAILELPKRHWAELQPIRLEHDRGYSRWMPHINLLYPFVPEAAFEDAAQLLAEQLATTPPFEVTLASIEHFTHEKTQTVWIGPQDPKPINALQATLEQTLPQCHEQSQRANTRSSSFTPHLTIARFERAQTTAMHEAKQRWQQTIKPMTMFVTHVALISRQDKSPFTIKQVIPLSGAGACQAALFNELGPRPELDATIDQLTTLIKATLDAPTQALTLSVGSVRHQTHNPSSDLDLLCITHQDPAILGAQLLEKLPAELKARGVLDATVPTLKLVYQGQEVDITLARYPETQPLIPPHQLDKPTLESLSLPTRMAIDGDLMAHTLFEELETSSAPDQLRLAIRMIKAWAKARGIFGAAWGFWGGTSWSLATIWATQELMARSSAHERLSAEDIVIETIARLCQWPWPNALPLHGAPKRYDALDAHMPVPNLIDPTRNTARSMTAHTAHITQQELQRARKITEAILDRRQHFGALLEPFTPTHTASARFALTPTAHTGALAALQRQLLQAQLALKDWPLRPCSLALPQDQHWLGLSHHGLTLQQERALKRALDLPALQALGVEVHIDASH